jgi:hypothetical protein
MARLPNLDLVPWLICIFIFINLHAGVIAFRPEPPFRQHNPGAKPTYPSTLDQVGYDSSNWTTIHRIGTLFACPEAKVISDPVSESDILIKTAVSTIPGDDELAYASESPNSTWANRST